MLAEGTADGICGEKVEDDLIWKRLKTTGRPNLEPDIQFFPSNHTNCSRWSEKNQFKKNITRIANAVQCHS